MSSKRTKKKTLLIDMDCTLVDMVVYWLKLYNKITGETLKEEDINVYEIQEICKRPDVMNNILAIPRFFYNLEPMPNAIKYFNMLVEDGHEVILATQLPRRSEYAANDKRDWIRKYFPDFDLSNLVFIHKKYLLKGDVLFDDKPQHLIEWKRNNKKGKTCKIEFAYNKDCKSDFTFKNKETAWEEFYETVSRM